MSSGSCVIIVLWFRCTSSCQEPGWWNRKGHCPGSLLVSQHCGVSPYSLTTSLCCTVFIAEDNFAGQIIKTVSYQGILYVLIRWLQYGQIKSIVSHDMYQIIFLVIKSPHKIPQNSICYIFTNLLPILAICDAARNIAVHIVYRFKILMIQYASDEGSHTELYRLRQLTINA